MNYEKIRRITLTALFSDDALFGCLVLKGGNALSLVHGISSRVSLDLDFSISGDVEDLANLRTRIETGLTRRFEPFGLAPFEVTLISKPTQRTPEMPISWGGYLLEFKLITKENKLRSNTSRRSLQRSSFVLGPDQQRKFKVDISKCEFTAPKILAQIDDYDIYVYPLPLIAAEKLRAICQQSELIGSRTRSPRARDFYDLYTIAEKAFVRLSSDECANLIPPVFAAKSVNLDLITTIQSDFDFHQDDWLNVRNSVAHELASFEFYFNYVLEEASKLAQVLGITNSP